MEPKEQLKALRWLEEHGMEVVAIFHSHPARPANPVTNGYREFQLSPRGHAHLGAQGNGMAGARLFDY